MNTSHFTSCFGLLVALVSTAVAAPLPSSITYQGRLSDGGAAANGRYDLVAQLYDAPAGGTVLGLAATNLNVPVSNGVFTTSLDFGRGVFRGGACWLDLAVRPSGGGSFTPLTPRQALTAVPYAFNALSVSGPAITASNIAPGQAVLSINGLHDGVTLTGTNGITVTNDGNALSISGGGWALQGNAGTSPGQTFLGTTDNQPLELRVNNARFLRAEPTTSGPNLIGGHAENQALAGTQGAVIAGGGQSGEPNVVGGPFSLISGGRANRVEVDANDSAIVGGNQNEIYTNAWSALIGGGQANYIDTYGDYAVVGGGVNNYVSSNAQLSVIVGGQDHVIGADAWACAIGGGSSNSLGSSAYAAVIAGGENNYLGAAYDATIGGGYFNYVDDLADYATVAGGADNWVKGTATFATIPGGLEAAAVSYGQLAYASGMDNDYGDAQASLYVLRGFTTNAVQRELFLDGGSQRMLVSSNGTWTFQIIFAVRSASGASAGFKAEGGVKNVGGTVTLVGTPVVTALGTDGGFSVASPTIAADNVNKALALRVNGSSGQRLKWVARVQTVELMF